MNEQTTIDLTGAKNQLKKEIIEAYIFLRENNNTIPSKTLEFMKDTAIDAVNYIDPNLTKQ